MSITRKSNIAQILGLGRATPAHTWTQEICCEVLAEHFELYRNHRVQKMFKNCGIDTRNFAMSVSEFDKDVSPGKLHELYKSTAPPLALEAAQSAIEDSQVKTDEIDFLVVATCTGYLCPGLTAYLTRDLQLSPKVQRADLVGMGCAGALPALQRGFD